MQNRSKCDVKVFFFKVLISILNKVGKKKKPLI